MTRPLLELQDGRCFYCDRERGRFEVDHFLAWSRLPDDRSTPHRRRGAGPVAASPHTHRRGGSRALPHQPAGTLLWADRQRVEPLDAGRLREVLLTGPLAAEDPGADEPR